MLFRSEAPAIVRTLVEAGADIFHMGPDDQSLEEIFLTMTRDSDA